MRQKASRIILAAVFWTTIFFAALVFLDWLASSFGFSFAQICHAVNEAIDNQTSQKYECTPINVFFFDAIGRLFSDNDRIIALATVVIAIFTASLWWATNKLQQLTSDIARAGHRQLAETAKVANAAIATERAWIFVAIEQDNLAHLMGFARYDNTPSMDESPTRTLEITLTFTNHGKTPAIIKEFSMSRIVCEKDPFIPVYGVVLNAFPETVLGPKYTTHPYVHRDAQPITHGDILAVARGEKWLWFVGRLDYTDVFGNPHIHRFYWRANGNVRWQPYDYQHYNQST